MTHRPCSLAERGNDIELKPGGGGQPQESPHPRREDRQGTLIAVAQMRPEVETAFWHTWQGPRALFPMLAMKKSICHMSVACTFKDKGRFSLTSGFWLLKGRIWKSLRASYQCRLVYFGTISYTVPRLLLSFVSISCVRLSAVISVVTVPSSLSPFEFLPARCFSPTRTWETEIIMN